MYSLAVGTVVQIAYGRSGSDGLSTVAIYDSSVNKTIIYLHTNYRKRLTRLALQRKMRKEEKTASESVRQKQATMRPAKLKVAFSGTIRRSFEAKSRSIKMQEAQKKKNVEKSRPRA